MKVWFWHFFTNCNSLYLQNKTVSSEELRWKTLLFKTRHLWNSTTELIQLCCAYVHRVRFFNFVREISSNIWLRYWYINLRLFCLWFAKCIKYSQTDHAQKKLDHKTYFSEENWFLLEVYHIPFDSFFLKVLYHHKVYWLFLAG